jgi:hypothetical protein
VPPLYFFNCSIVISMTLLLIHVCVCDELQHILWEILNNFKVSHKGKDLLNKFTVHRNDRNLLSKLKLTVMIKTLYHNSQL